jgi:hypothetical protein
VRSGVDMHMRIVVSLLPIHGFAYGVCFSVVRQIEGFLRLPIELLACCLLCLESSVQRPLFFFDFIVREDVALSVFIRSLHEFVVGGINGLSVVVQLMLVSITAVDSSVFCVSVVIRDVFRVPNIWFTRCDALF